MMIGDALGLSRRQSNWTFRSALVALSICYLSAAVSLAVLAYQRDHSLFEAAAHLIVLLSIYAIGMLLAAALRSASRRTLGQLSRLGPLVRLADGGLEAHLAELHETQNQLQQDLAEAVSEQRGNSKALAALGESLQPLTGHLQANARLGEKTLAQAEKLAEDQRRIAQRIKELDDRTFDLSKQFVRQTRSMSRLVGSLHNASMYDGRPAARVAAGLPLLLIGQVERSGGTLFAHLLDGHSAILAFPRELHWGGAKKYQWPDVDPRDAAPMHVARGLLERHVRLLEEFNSLGYSKVNKGAPAGAELPMPFRWCFWTYAEVFLDEWQQREPRSRRDAFDIFMTAFFSAFLSLPERHEPKSYVSAFVPRANFIEEFPENENFFVDYPDGYLISLCRDAVSWYASGLQYRKDYQDLDLALAAWKQSVTSALALRKRYPERVILVGYEDLVNDTRAVMGRIVERVGLPWEDCLTVPTFNGRLIESNSSFAATAGIDRGPLDRSGHLPEEVGRRITAETAELRAAFLDQATKA